MREKVKEVLLAEEGMRHALPYISKVKKSPNDL